jgi:hypothetical protein
MATIQVRDVPDEVAEVIAEKAAAEHKLRGNVAHAKPKRVRAFAGTLDRPMEPDRVATAFSGDVIHGTLALSRDGDGGRVRFVCRFVPAEGRATRRRAIYVPEHIVDNAPS